MYCNVVDYLKHAEHNKIDINHSTEIESRDQLPRKDNGQWVTVKKVEEAHAGYSVSNESIH